MKMSKITKIIKKLFGTEVVLNLIANPFLYKDNAESFCGGTLAEESILVVTNLDRESQLQMIVQKLETEKCLHSMETDIEWRTLKESSNIVPYEHIINIIDCNKEGIDIYSVYQLLQKEADYVIEKSLCTSICTVVLSQDHVARMTLSTLIKGLGKALGIHGIVNNGVVAKTTASLETAINSAIYLSSKFGQIMAGEVLEMGE